MTDIPGITPEHERRATEAAFAHMNELRAQMPSTAEVLERKKELASELGPKLSSNCAGRFCPVLSAIGLAHEMTRNRIASAMVRKERGESLLDLSTHVDNQRNQFFDTLMRRVDEGTMAEDTADALIEIAHSAVDQLALARGQNPDIAEVDHAEVVKEKERQITEGKARFAKLAELHSRLWVNKHGFGALSVLVRRALGFKPKAGECFGAWFDSQGVTAKGEFICTNAGLALFYAAVDAGVLELDELYQYLDQRPDSSGE